MSNNLLLIALITVIIIFGFGMKNSYGSNLEGFETTIKVCQPSPSDMNAPDWGPFPNFHLTKLPRVSNGPNPTYQHWKRGDYLINPTTCAWRKSSMQL